MTNDPLINLADVLFDDLMKTPDEELLAEEAGMPCIFCGKPAGDDPVIDDNGSTACKPCGAAEYKAQAEEGFR